MNASRLQHVVPAGAIFALAITVTWLSFTQEPAEAFVFPRIISIAFVVLATWNLARAALGLARVGGGLSSAEIRNVSPGLMVMLIYIFFAAKTLGFYFASTIAFFAVYSIYDPAPFASAKDWVKRIIITAAFMVVIYGLFALVLQVQTPRGLLI